MEKEYFSEKAKIGCQRYSALSLGDMKKYGELYRAKTGKNPYHADNKEDFYTFIADEVKMDDTELKQRVIELIEQEDFKKYLKKEVDSIIKSGYVDASKEETGTYGLAKVVLYCALRGLARQYYPMSDYYRKKYKSLIKNYGE